MGFNKQYEEVVLAQNSLVCVGLDPVMDKLPEHLQGVEHPFFEFSKAIVDATAEYVAAFKPNAAFFEALGRSALEEAEMVIRYIKENYPAHQVIYDAKRGDIDSTNMGYVKSTFDFLGADAITIHPYLGMTANQPFLDQKDKGIIVLCRTSNPGASEFQDLDIGGGKKLYQKVAENVSTEWNKKNDNCLLVVGATYPGELEEVRRMAGDEMNILMPGIGAQGGKAEDVIPIGINSRGTGLIVNSSRGIIYASSGTDFAEVAGQEAKKLRDEINQFRKAA